MREINRKALVITVVLMAVAMLSTPFVGMVIAGKGQEKLSFRLVMIGHNMPPAKVIETENTIYYIDLGFMCQNPLTNDPSVLVEIGGVALPDSRIGGGSALIHLNAYSNTVGYTIQVNDIITIKAADEHVMGEIVTVAMGNLNKSNGLGGGMNFEG